MAKADPEDSKQHNAHSMNEQNAMRTRKKNMGFVRVNEWKWAKTVDIKVFSSGKFVGSEKSEFKHQVAIQAISSSVFCLPYRYQHVYVS